MKNLYCQKSSPDYSISLTGYRMLVIFRLLLESPKSIDDLKQVLKNDNYTNEELSDDTIRTYINSLRTEGCVISKATKSTGNKYILLSHPLEYNINPSHLNILRKIFREVISSENYNNLIKFEAFILKLASVIKDEKTANYLYGLTVINKINPEIYQGIKECCLKNKRVILTYYSPASPLQDLEFLCDKLVLKSGNLYVAGYNFKHKNYSTLLINRIRRITALNSADKPLLNTNTDIICEIYDKNYELAEDEELISLDKNKLTVKLPNKDDFRTRQKIMQMGNLCKVISPANYKNNIKNILTEMRKLYD